MVVTVSDITAEISTNGDAAAFELCAHGTTTPMIGYEVQPTLSSVVTSMLTIQFLISGLTPGSSYNFDLMWCVKSGSTATIYAIGQTGTSPSLGGTGVGALSQ